MKRDALRYDGTTGAFIDVFVPAGSGGLDTVSAIVFGPDGNLYASSQAPTSDSVLRYDGTTGAFIDAFVPCLGVFAVTQSQYRQVMGTKPRRFSPTGDGRDKVSGLDTNDFPVENVSWEEAMDFCRIVSLLPGVRDKGWIVDLPTEAEWEYACRARSLGYEVASSARNKKPRALASDPGRQDES